MQTTATGTPARPHAAPDDTHAPEAGQLEERGMGEAQHVSLTYDPRLRLFALFINFLVILELFVAMFFASQDPDRLTPVFFKLFFSMLAPTIIAAVVGRRVIGKRLAAKSAQ